MSFAKKLACRDEVDIGVTFHFDGRNYKATKPHGVLDPQPDSHTAELMARNNVYKWLGINEKGEARLQSAGANAAPTLEEMRRSIENQRVVRGSPNFKDPEIRRASDRSKATNAEKAAQPAVTSAGLPSPKEMRAQHSRAEAVMADQVVKVIDLDAEPPTYIEPRGAAPDIKPAFQGEVASEGPVDALAAFAGNLEEIERVSVIDPDLVAGTHVASPPSEEADPFADAAEELSAPAAQPRPADLTQWTEADLRVEARTLGVKNWETLSKSMMIKQIRQKLDD